MKSHPRPSLRHRLSIPAWARALLPAVLIACTLPLAGTVQAQTVPANIALPFYTPNDFMEGAWRHWYAPRSADFAAQSAALVTALNAYCDATPGTGATDARVQARQQWQRAAAVWDRMAGVQVGPMLQRRSSRQIDFSPTRPALIKRAIQRAPADVDALETVGTPAKGLPAIEYLLWTEPAAPASPACRYASVLAAEVAREGTVLSATFADLARTKPGTTDADREAEEEKTSVPAMSELVNQWVGGLERLRWSHMEKPRMSSAQGAGNAGGYPRAASGQTAAAWAGEWQALRTLAISRERGAPDPATSVVALETYLRGRGLNPLANKLVHSVEKTDQLMQNLSPRNAAGMQQASRALADLKRLAEAELAPALEVNIGFSDADGD
ncbi:MAG: imelysin family protein [Polaromonas sp.]|nr:imelysin family protein [Polaromonas sp.]